MLGALAERVTARDAVRQISASSPCAVRLPSEATAGRAELLGDADALGGRRRERRRDGRRERQVSPTRDSRVARAPGQPHAAALALAAQSTDSLRRSRALMGEELEKGRRTLAALEESRATMRKTGDEYAGEQRAALAGGGRSLSRLERQAAWERRTLWLGFACFMLAAAHVVLKRTPVLVRFTRCGGSSAAGAKPSRRRTRKRQPAKSVSAAPTPTPVAAAVAAAAAAAAAAMDAAAAAGESGGVADAVYAGYLDGQRGRVFQ